MPVGACASNTHSPRRGEEQSFPLFPRRTLDGRAFSAPPLSGRGAISPALPSTPQKGNSNLLLDSAKKCWRRVGARESEGKGGFKNPPSSRLPPPVSDWHPEAFLPRRLSAGARAQGSLTLKTIALPAPRANQGRPSPLKSSSGEKNPAA